MIGSKILSPFVLSACGGMKRGIAYFQSCLSHAMKDRLLFLISLVTLVCCCASLTWALETSGKSSPLRNLLPLTVLGWTPSEEDAVFTRETIFEYMNGAGELYLAYDFDVLLVRQYEKPAAPPIVVELYQMQTSADAYGLFVHDTDGEPVALGAGAFYSAGYAWFWKGNLFGRIMADRETEESKAAVLALGKLITDTFSQDGAPPELLAYLPPDGLLPRTIRYFHTIMALNAHYYLADENLLNLDEQTNVVLATYQQANRNVRLLLVQYPNPDLAQTAFDQFVSGYWQSSSATGSPMVIKQREDAQWGSARRAGAFVILVFEAPDETTCVNLTETTMKLLGKYAQ